MQADAVAITALRPRLEKLTELLENVDFNLPTDGRDEAERIRTAVVRTISEYLLPRLDEPEAPVVAAMIGPSGTGKSTIVNSLASDRISDVGPLRPTTRTPVLWAHREHGSRYWTKFVSRVRERVGSTVEVVIGDDELTAELTIIDTPPSEYVAPSGRNPALDVLALADLCVFVTSPSRYADISAWDFLREIRWRGVPMLFVLNRLPPDRSQAAALLDDFAHRLHDNGLLLEPDAAMVFGVDEAVGDRWHGGLDASSVGALRNELGAVSNTTYRTTLVSMTAYTTGRNVVDRCRVIGEEFARVARITDELDEAVSRAYEGQVGEVARMMVEGDLSEVARHRTWSEATVDLTAIVTRRAGVAAQETASTWTEHETGKILLAGTGSSLWRHTEDTSWDVQGRLEEWQEVLAQVIARNSKAGGLRPRSAARLATNIWPLVVDPALRPPRAVRRRFKHNLEALVEEAQGSLAGVIREALEYDARRFRAHLDDHAETAASLERQLRTISALLRGEELPPLESVAGDAQPVSEEDSIESVAEGDDDA